MKGSPFTHLCRQLTVLRPGRADLHTHTTFSDGTHTPAGLVERAIKAGLKAVAITDHDTTAGVEAARAAAGGAIEVIAGVEVTAEFRGAEIHLLGYFVRPGDEPLAAALRDLQESRRERLLEMARRLKASGADVEPGVAALPAEVSLGRRHLARLLIAAGHSRSLHGAFTRWLAGPDIVVVPKRRLAAADAIARICGAGGVASWAHPPANLDLREVEALRAMGLQALECVYPWPSRAHEVRLRQLAKAAGLAVTGGSDSHDPGPATRAIGARTVTLDEVATIRGLAATR
ncbi:MAG: PHP domain-containing protein [Zavarzinella sp.]|nr:PHP domain-containing protein [Zavarzinella sp.]